MEHSYKQNHVAGSRYHQVPITAAVPSHANNLSSSSSGDYSDSCSSSDCSSSSWSSVSIPEWESQVDHHGELFYIQFGSHLVPETKPERMPSSEERQEVLKKKKKSRLSRLLKRREDSKSQTMSAAGVTQSSKLRSTSSSPVYMPTNVHQQSPADDWTDWTCFTLELEVHPIIPLDPTSSSGRRRNGSNLCETLLGFAPGVTQSVEWHGQAALRQRVIVDALVPGGPLHQGGFAHVQPGDWLERLNGRDVTHRELDDILGSINSREIVELNFRRRPSPSIIHADCQDQDQTLSNAESTLPPHGVLLLSQENVTDSSPEMADILFQSAAGGAAGIDPLLKWRGAAVTLVHLMPQLTGSSPSSSTIVLDGLPIHLAYIVEDAALFLIAAPSNWYGLVELQMITNQLGILFRFQYGSIRRALTEPRWADEIRRTVDSLFSGLVNNTKQHQSCTAAGGELVTRPIGRLSDFFTTCGQWLPLPPESHLDVTLTLNQMEAMDYEDWDEDGITVQRCATITGSAVYCQGYLVASTLTGSRLEKVASFLKWNQILEMSHRRRLQSLILWREVFLCGDPDDDGNRSFILVVGSGHILVAALLQGGGVTQPWDNYPDTFLIEEMQFFLEELEFLELETICNKILNGPHNPVLVTNLVGLDAAETKISESATFNITPGLKPTLINYLSMDFGTGVVIAPTLTYSGIKFSSQFQKTALKIHKLFQQTLKSKVDLQSPDWGGPWSDKSLVALQEVSVLFNVPETPPSPNGITKVAIKAEAFWVTGRLFTSPVHRELFVCHQDGVAQDILDLAFHLGFGASL